MTTETPTQVGGPPRVDGARYTLTVTGTLVVDGRYHGTAMVDVLVTDTGGRWSLRHIEQDPDVVLVLVPPPVPDWQPGDVIQQHGAAGELVLMRGAGGFWRDQHGGTATDDDVAVWWHDGTVTVIFRAAT